MLIFLLLELLGFIAAFILAFIPPAIRHCLIGTKAVCNRYLP
ncbi:hypothetical protein SALWKB12_0740 [Snodgrassella communis]|nr:hypothetical protein SALWKB12_0740 [Snodgrassella communis]